MAGKITTALIHLTAFWNVAVMNCIKPVNWQYCSKDLDVWLYPELIRGWEILTDDPCLYCEEKESLNK